MGYQPVKPPKGPARSVFTKATHRMMEPPKVEAKEEVQEKEPVEQQPVAAKQSAVRPELMFDWSCMIPCGRA